MEEHDHHLERYDQDTDILRSISPQRGLLRLKALQVNQLRQDKKEGWWLIDQKLIHGAKAERES